MLEYRYLYYEKVSTFCVFIPSLFPKARAELNFFRSDHDQIMIMNGS